MAIRNVNLWRSIDWFTVILYFVLVVFGWLSIYSATYDFGEFADLDFLSFDTNTGKQLLWIGCALVIALVLLSVEKKY